MAAQASPAFAEALAGEIVNVDLINTSLVQHHERDEGELSASAALTMQGFVAKSQREEMDQIREKLMKSSLNHELDSEAGARGNASRAER